MPVLITGIFFYNFVMSEFIPKILVIAGSDSGGGAGIQADIKAITYFKGYAMTAITAVTAQNTLGVQHIYPLPLDVIKDQITSVLDDLDPDVIKIGMIADVKLLQYLKDIIFDKKVVLDPVMVATSGDVLVPPEVIAYLKKTILGKSFLITPNLYEAEILADMKINSFEDQIKCGKILKSKGCKNVLIKGGHTDGRKIIDLLITENNKIHEFKSLKIPSKHTHGTGCTLASAIATNIALGRDIPQCIETSIEYVQRGITNAPNFGQGNGPIRHF